MDLRGKVSLVTGAARRVGREIALGLASRGSHVVITYRTSSREALATVRAIEEKGVRGFALRVDQRKRADVQRAVRRLMATFRRVDVLVNNASSFYPTPWKSVTPAANDGDRAYPHHAGSRWRGERGR